MASGLVITQTIADADPTRAIVTLTGTPNGPLTFWASEVPDSSTAIQIGYTGSNPYHVTVSHPDGWYFWAQDNDGFTLPDACWLGTTGEAETVECGRYVRQILDDNKLLLDRALQRYYSGATVKQILYGGPSDIYEFPSVLVTQPSWRSEWVAMPDIREITISLPIMCMMLNSAEYSLLQYGQSFGMAVERVLRRSAYRLFRLPNGVEVAFGQVVQGSTEEVEHNEGFGLVSSLTWTGNMLIQDTGN